MPTSSILCEERIGLIQFQLTGAGFWELWHPWLASSLITRLDGLKCSLVASEPMHGNCPSLAYYSIPLHQPPPQPPPTPPDHTLSSHRPWGQLRIARLDEYKKKKKKENKIKALTPGLQRTEIAFVGLCHQCCSGPLFIRLGLSEQWLNIYLCQSILSEANAMQIICSFCFPVVPFFNTNSAIWNCFQQVQTCMLKATTQASSSSIRVASKTKLFMVIHFWHVG